MKKLSYSLVILVVSLMLFPAWGLAKSKTKPNIIYILADDLGLGDVSCYGQKDFETPNIDKLARQGMKFYQHYSGSAVCAPSRCTLMTGLHTGHAIIRGNKELKGQEGQTPMPDETVTVAEVLKRAGYATGAFGKWGLGFPGSVGDPNMQGFDVFYGYNCQRMAHRYYPPYLWDNQKKDYLKGNDWTHTVTYAPDEIQKRALRFIEDHKDEPFFAYVPVIQPHAELIVPDDSILAKFKGRFEEPEFDPALQNYASDYGPDINPVKYCYQKTPKAVFAAMVYRIDVYVGQIMEKLKELGLEENTIVMFSSDNGPHDAGGANPKYFNSAAGLRGIKRDLYQGGIRTPFLVKWPAKVKPGSESNLISAFWDVMPTLAQVAGVKLKTHTDGISFLPELLGQKQRKTHEYLYWEFPHKGGRQSVRLGDWKGVLYNLNDPSSKIELYNLSNDVTESNDVAAAHPEIVSRIKAIFAKEHQESKLFPLYKKN